MKSVILITDGSININPGGLGKWCAVIKYNKKELILRGTEQNSTNNRAEMLGLCNALPILIKFGVRHIKVISDSQYLGCVIKGGKKWYHKKQFKKKANSDLWRPLIQDVLNYGIQIEFQWVKGHNGNCDNERVDSLASTYDKRIMTSKLYEHV